MSQGWLLIVHKFNCDKKILICFEIIANVKKFKHIYQTKITMCGMGLQQSGVLTKESTRSGLTTGESSSRQSQSGRSESRWGSGKKKILFTIFDFLCFTSCFIFQPWVVFLFSTHWPQFSFFNIVLFLVFNGHLMQGHWATLSLFKLKLSVEAEGKGRWRSMFDPFCVCPPLLGNTLTRLSNQFVICTLSM